MNLKKKQYNSYYTNIMYEGKEKRLYNEVYTNSLNALYSETQIKLIELIENFNFKIFYISNSAKNSLKITFNESENVNLNNPDVITIKNFLGEDLYFLYEKQLFEVLYYIPKLNNSNNYYFNMLLVVNKDFDINTIYNHSFNLVNIKSINQINVTDIDYNWVENIFEKRNIFYNVLKSQDKKYYNDIYDLNKIDLSYDDFFKNFNNGSENFELEKYHNKSSLIFYKNLNQNLYVKNCFRLLDMQIWSFYMKFVKIKNKFGYKIGYLEFYDISSIFLTNYAELIESVLVEFKNNNTWEINNECYTYCSFRNNFIDQFIVNGILEKGLIKTDFANLNNLQFEDEFFKNIFRE